MRGFSLCLCAAGLVVLSVSAVGTAAEDAAAAGPEIVCACPRNLVWNCGVDGKTYSNHCVRECAQVDLKHEGRCDNEEEVPPQVPEASVGEAESIDEEAAPEGRTEEVARRRLSREDDVQEEAESRTEEPREEGENAKKDHTSEEGPQNQEELPACACPLNLMLNCGVDGRTYSNHCERECQGVDLLHEGPCEDDEDLYPGIPDDVNSE